MHNLKQHQNPSQDKTENEMHLMVSTNSKYYK